MSIERGRRESTASDADGESIADLIGDRAIARDDHINAPGFVVPANEVQSVLFDLRDEMGFDHLSCVTAQEYQDRYETIYHLTKYDARTEEVDVVVPSSKETPWNQSAAPVYSTAGWHEREAYDLVGIEYEDHPDLRRILLPESWQGHPLSLDYDQTQPQIVEYKATEKAAQGGTVGAASTTEDDAEGAESEQLFVNIGPHHPATHGVLHLKTLLDGEVVTDVDPDIGYLHRCEEQMCQQGTYRHKIIPYSNRWDYTSNLTNEWAVARAIEDLNDIDVPEYATVLRTMATELSRMFGHFLAVATFALDINGDFTATFMYAFRDREEIQNLLEDLTGQRMMFYYFRVGGVSWDVPEPRSEWFDNVREFLDVLPRRITEYHDLLSNNELFQMRTVDTGYLDPETAKDYGATGPVARASGVDYDLRRDDPYGYYPELDWNVVLDDGCDNYARTLVRLREIEESARIVDQCIDLLEGWPEDDRQLQSNVPRTLRPERDAEIYRAVEIAKGELGVYIRSDGTDSPARFKIRSPCFHNLSTLPEMAEGELLPDLIASVGSLDLVLGSVDR